MQKTKYFTYVYHPVSFFCPKRCQIKFKYYLIMKINSKKELKNVTINHAADIGYNDFTKIYRECTKIPCSFLTTDTTLPASDPLRFRKNLFHPYKNDCN